MSAPRYDSPPRLPMIAPSILSADFGHMADDCAHILGAGADALHLDVMDGHFVPNLTMGPDMCRWVRKACPDALLDVHLMVDDPGAYIEPFAKAGANHLTFHVEVAPARSDIRALASRIRERGMSAGVALNPPTEARRLLDNLDPADIDLVLVMSVNPGFSGQSFIESTLDTTRAVRAAVGDRVRVQMDGGVSPASAPACRHAGCDVLVAASAIFGKPREDRAGVIRTIRGQEP